jgi:methyl-accepting chemotaxis protein
MDQATQQNAALVEEMAAAASSLKSQALELVQTVSVFKLDDSNHAVTLTPVAARANTAVLTRPDTGRTAPKPAAQVTRLQPRSAQRPVESITPAKTGTDDWASF